MTMGTVIEVPDFWMLFDPKGSVSQSTLGTYRDGSIHLATMEDAWRSFFTRARERETRKRQGWRVVGVSRGDWMDFWSGARKPDELIEEAG